MTEENEKYPPIHYDRLKKLLAEKTWKASELAQYSGIKYDTAYAIVTGRRPNPTAETLDKIATALGCTSDYLLGRANNRYPPIEKLPEQVRQLSRIAGKLSHARQEELLIIAEALEDLERKQPVYTLPGEAMEGLLQVLEKLEGDSAQAETYESLQRIFAGAAPWLLSSRSSEGGDDLTQH